MASNSSKILPKVSLKTTLKKRPLSSKNEKIVILDFGSQYTQVIARRVRECHVFSEILPHTTKASLLAKDPTIRGIILSGGPASVYAKKAPTLDTAIYKLGVPILGICYGMQLMTRDLGGVVARSQCREYGSGELTLTGIAPLFKKIKKKITVWNSHGDRIEKLPKGFSVLGSTENSPNAVIGDLDRNFYGLQFHPEVAHTEGGKEMLQNFLHSLCGCTPSWKMDSFIERSCEAIRAQVGQGRVILGLSGGVDSSVAAALLHRAIGDQLTCIFVDNGLLRSGERKGVSELFAHHFKIRLKVVRAKKQFLMKLQGVSDPEKKRKIIGKEFIHVFEEAAKELQLSSKRTSHPFKFLAQGTLYPDVIESVPIGNNPASLIKSHHNVGGLPKKMKFELVEPLRQLFKDEVRELGRQLGLPREVVDRQPFPGPGLAVRIIGSITPERLKIVRDADSIVIEEMKASGWYYKVWQSFAVLLPVQSVGVMGDERTYDKTIAIRMVESQDGMTANWVPLPYEILAKISSRIINEVDGINRCVYDISNKPPATIEWE
ncbi:MAG: glutamine-hydrolyzing GMP synthase [Verrucomicrobia bacterium]|nr:MAG: glutamine-hydrolyzing GMP synthase [Verrucomicrobiota bacterium]